MAEEPPAPAPCDPAPARVQVVDGDRGLVWTADGTRARPHRTPRMGTLAPPPTPPLPHL